MAGRKVRAPEKTLAVVDHNVPTTDRSHGIDDPESRDAGRDAGQERRAISASNISTSSIARQGIVHIIGPEQGFTLPGTTIVCGDSHTSTHGAFGALAHGIGTSEVEHVLATQTLIQKKAKNMRVTVDGKLPRRRHRQGHHPRHHRRDRHRRRHRPCHRICRRGDPRAVDGRPHDGLQHVDRGRRARRHDRARREDLRLSQGPAEGAQGRGLGRGACAYWETLHTDEGAHFDREVKLDAANLPPIVTWGTSPEDVVSITGVVPEPERCRRARASAPRSSGRSTIWASSGGTKITDIALDRVFIGSCTNGRIEDLRAVAKIVDGQARSTPASTP